MKLGVSWKNTTETVTETSSPSFIKAEDNTTPLRWMLLFSSAKEVRKMNPFTAPIAPALPIPGTRGKISPAEKAEITPQIR